MENEYERLTAVKKHERLVAVNFQGLLPSHIANKTSNLLKDKKVCKIVEFEYKDEIYSREEIKND